MDQPAQRAALGTEPVRTIDREELKAKLDRGDAFKLIMALNRWAFDAKHIPGSLHFDTPDELYAAVRPDDEVVVYCSHLDCLSSVALYRDLVRRGYRNVRRYSGGLLDWEDAGLPLEGEFAPSSVMQRTPQIGVIATRPSSKPSVKAGTRSRTCPSLTPEECLEPGYYRDPDWTVRDVVAHVGTWLAEAEVQLEQIRAGTYEGHDVDIDGAQRDVPGRDARSVLGGRLGPGERRPDPDAPGVGASRSPTARPSGGSASPAATTTRSTSIGCANGSMSWSGGAGSLRARLPVKDPAPGQESVTPQSLCARSLSSRVTSRSAHDRSGSSDGS